MSAVDFVARGLALRAAATAKRATGSASPMPVPSPSLETFVTLARTPTGISGTIVESCGHTVPGLGAGRYVHDAMATRTLAAAHPKACFTAADGRVFRLCGDAEGFVTPEQLGCAMSSPGTDQRVAIQSALDYGKAAGLNGVKFPQPHYELWSPPRTASFADQTSASGCFLVIDGWPCALIGLHPLKTTLHFAGPQGQSLVGDYQVLTAAEHGGEVIWRGHGIVLAGEVPLDQPRPEPHQMAHLALRNLILTTGAIAPRNTSSPALPPSRDPTGARQNCHDPSNCGIWQQSGVHTGDITIENAELSGFLGETIHTAAGYGASLSLRNVSLGNANGAALKLQGPKALLLDGVMADNCGSSWDGFYGLDHSTVRSTRFLSCGGGGLESAAARLDGLRPDGTPPTTHLDVSFEDCGEQRIGAHAQGRVYAVDTPMALVQSDGTRWLRGISLDLVATCHASSVPAAIRYAGNADGSARITDTEVRLTMIRTAQAQDSGFHFTRMFEQSGPIGPRNYLRAQGPVESVGDLVSVSENYVGVIDEGLDLSAGAGAATPFDPSTIASPDMGTGALRGATFSAGNGLRTVNLPSTAMFPDGAQISIEHRDATKPLCFMELTDSNLKRALLGYRDRAVFQCNKALNRWDLVRAPVPRSVTANIGLNATAMNAESGPYTVPFPGCRPWHLVELIPSGSLGGFAISNLRAEMDQVRFWVKNYTGGSSYSLAPQIYTARCSIPVS